MKDALDNDIIIGNMYGASYTCDGKDTIVIGKALKVNSVKTTLEVVSGRYMSRFDHDWQPIKLGTKKPIYHIKLFPVSDSVNKEKLKDSITNLIEWYEDDFFNDSSGISTMDVLRAEDPKKIKLFEDKLRNFIGD